MGIEVASKEDLQSGDLMFQKNTDSRGGITHVGIYIGDGKVINNKTTGVNVVIEV